MAMLTGCHRGMATSAIGAGVASFGPLVRTNNISGI